MGSDAEEMMLNAGAEQGAGVINCFSYSEYNNVNHQVSHRSDEFQLWGNEQPKGRACDILRGELLFRTVDDVVSSTQQAHVFSNLGAVLLDKNEDLDELEEQLCDKICYVGVARTNCNFDGNTGDTVNPQVAAVVQGLVSVINTGPMTLGVRKWILWRPQPPTRPRLKDRGFRAETFSVDPRDVGSIANAMSFKSVLNTESHVTAMSGPADFLLRVSAKISHAVMSEWVDPAGIEVNRLGSSQANPPDENWTCVDPTGEPAYVGYTFGDIQLFMSYVGGLTDVIPDRFEQFVTTQELYGPIPGYHDNSMALMRMYQMRMNGDSDAHKAESKAHVASLLPFTFAIHYKVSSRIIGVSLDEGRSGDLFDCALGPATGSASGCVI